MAAVVDVSSVCAVPYSGALLEGVAQAGSCFPLRVLHRISDIRRALFVWSDTDIVNTPESYLDSSTTRLIDRVFTLQRVRVNKFHFYAEDTNG